MQDGLILPVRFMINTSILLTGSNVGDRLQNLRTAREILIGEGYCSLVSESSVYETGAWGNINQSAFLNQAIAVKTALQPLELLHVILNIEKQMGRERNEKWEPRLIDIDIIFYNDEVIKTEALVLPHPFVHERKFALVPLAEIIPDWVHPVFQKTVSTLLQEVNDPLEVKKK